MIAAEGEQKSSKALKEAADIIAMSPAALQLRYLQVSTAGDNLVSSDFVIDARRDIAILTTRASND